MWNLPGKFTQFGDKPGRSFCDSECLGCPRCGCKGRGREGNLQSLPGAVDHGEIPLLLRVELGELPAHSSRITPQHPPRAAGKAGMQRIPSHQGQLSPGMGNTCQAGKNPWLGSLQGLKRGGNPGWEALSRKSPGAEEVPALLCVPAGSGAGRESWELRMAQEEVLGFVTNEEKCPLQCVWHS